MKPLEDRLTRFPRLRYMGSKHRLLPWILEVLSALEFTTVLDPFSGSGCVGYMFKALGKEVTTSDFLRFPAVVAQALVENRETRLREQDLGLLLEDAPGRERFVEETFSGIFYTPEDLRFLDRVWWNLPFLDHPHRRALALAALIRSCAKRQPRGVFTVAGDPERYKDGRRDLRLSLEEHFPEQVEALNAAVFDGGRPCRALTGDAFDIDPEGYDLVYLDPPYVPRSDDNCYMKRYHFLEGLSCYWRGVEIQATSKVRKIEKPYTPFSYRHQAVDAFDRLFRRFAESTLVLSYSSNGYPDLEVLVDLMERYKPEVRVFERDHRYCFGTHEAVRRSEVREYLVVGDGTRDRHGFP